MVKEDYSGRDDRGWKKGNKKKRSRQSDGAGKPLKNDGATTRMQNPSRSLFLS
jgi:hypothetical protein